MSVASSTTPSPRTPSRPGAGPDPGPARGPRQRAGPGAAAARRRPHRLPRRLGPPRRQLGHQPRDRSPKPATSSTTPPPTPSAPAATSPPPAPSSPASPTPAGPPHHRPPGPTGAVAARDDRPRDTSTSCSTAALDYAARGWPVFPLVPYTQRPAFPAHTAAKCNAPIRTAGTGTPAGNNAPPGIPAGSAAPGPSGRTGSGSPAARRPARRRHRQGQTRHLAPEAWDTHRHPRPATPS